MAAGYVQNHTRNGGADCGGGAIAYTTANHSCAVLCGVCVCVGVAERAGGLRTSRIFGPNIFMQKILVSSLSSEILA